MALANSPWQKGVDRGTLQPYYFNTTTNEATWGRPMDYKTPPDGTYTQQVIEEADPVVPLMALPNSPWQKAVDQTTHQPYFFNTTTLESTYDRPNGYESSRVYNNNAGGQPGVPVAAIAGAAALNTTTYNNTHDNSYYQQDLTYTQQLETAPLALSTTNGPWQKAIDPSTSYPYYYNRSVAIRPHPRLVCSFCILDDYGVCGWWCLCVCVKCYGGEHLR